MLDTRHNPRLKSHNISKFAMITYSVTDDCFRQTYRNGLSFSVQIEHGGKFNLRNLIKPAMFYNDQTSIRSVTVYHLQYPSVSFSTSVCVRACVRARACIATSRGVTERTASYNRCESTQKRFRN
jgi:hypothetical protein